MNKQNVLNKIIIPISIYFEIITVGYITEASVVSIESPKTNTPKTVCILLTE